VRSLCVAGPYLLGYEILRQASLHEATVLELNPLSTCRGARPWLGRNANEDCKLPSRLLIRTAANAYFSHHRR